MELKTGDILLVDTEGFIPSKIDWFQGNDYNHAGFIIVAHGKTWVFEAINVGVAFTPFDKYKDRLDNEDINLLVLRPNDKYLWKERTNALMQYLMERTQYPYEYTNLILHQGIRYLTRKLFGRSLWIGKKKTKSTKAFICGELVMDIYNHFHGFFSGIGYKGAPVDIYNDKNFKHIKYVK